MRLERLVVRGFRNLDNREFCFPPGGVAFLGDNGQGKTNLLEAVYYPVFFRSVHGAPDQDVAGFGGPGFQLEAELAGGPARSLKARYAGRRKQVEVDGAPAVRMADHVGHWLAVAFLPQDLRLADGPATERRRYLDRMLAIADRTYYAALVRYRSALAQRNAALRQGRTDLARAFDASLGRTGAAVIAARLRWVADAAPRLAAGLDALGEPAPVSIGYSGRDELSDPAAWSQALDAAEKRDRVRQGTSVGPHRDDLDIRLGGRSARSYGSTGQQRTIAVALKLLELGTLEAARGTEPALLLDDVFAELDRERQERLARRLLSGSSRQVFLTSPREDELPSNLELPVWRVAAGRVIT